MTGETQLGREGIWGSIRSIGARPLTAREPTGVSLCFCLPPRMDAVPLLGGPRADRSASGVPARLTRRVVMGEAP